MTRIDLKKLSEYGLDAHMLRDMTESQIREYFTARNLSEMFGPARTQEDDFYMRTEEPSLDSLATAAIEIHNRLVGA